MTTDEETTYRPYIEAYIKEWHEAGSKSPTRPTSERARQTQYRLWRTYQLSDHLPLWAEFNVEFSDEYLADLAASTPRASLMSTSA